MSNSVACDFNQKHECPNKLTNSIPRCYRNGEVVDMQKLKEVKPDHPAFTHQGTYENIDSLLIVFGMFIFEQA